MFFQCINIRQVPWEVLKTAAFGLGFQHLPRDLANVNAWKTMFELYINGYSHGMQPFHGTVHNKTVWGLTIAQVLIKFYLHMLSLRIGLS